MLEDDSNFSLLEDKKHFHRKDEKYGKTKKKPKKA